MDVVLISTSDVSAGRSAALERMLASVDAVQAARPGLTMRLFLLLQRDAGVETVIGQSQLVALDTTAERMSLSAARNRLLARAFAEGVIGDDTVVAFPDDDAWYPAGTLERIVALFADDPALDFWFCRYGSSPASPGATTPAGAGATTAQVIRNASSNTIFIRGRVARAVGRFDETLGVGTPAGGAEDTDYALSCLAVARRVAFVDAQLIGHRDKDTTLRARYFHGSLIAIARHAGRVPGVTGELVRKVAVGLALLARRELAPGAYAGALAAAASGRLQKR